MRRACHILAEEPPDFRGTGSCVAALEATLCPGGGATSQREAVLRAANPGDDLSAGPTEQDGAV